MQKHILAASGGFVFDGVEWRLGPIVRYGLSLAESKRPKICFITTANGDQPTSIDAHMKACENEPVEASYLRVFKEPNVDNIRNFLLEQDMIWVAGGSDANMLAVWKVHHVDEILREAWESGVVLGGISAGSVCWHSGGVTDAYGSALRSIGGCLELVPFSNNVHYDTSQERKEVYHQAIKDGVLSDGYATEDGVALHYLDGVLNTVITEVEGKNAYKVELIDGGIVETVIKPDFVG